MNKRVHFVFLFLVLFLFSSSAVEKTPVDYVNPWIASCRSRYFFFNTACRPFGMVNLSPDTKLEGTWSSGYLYDHKYVKGLTHIHQWLAGGLLVMPTIGEIDPCKGQEEWKSAFSHDTEIVRAGYHKLHLDKYDIDVELTSTDHVGLHRYTFQKDGQADILFFLGGILDRNTMTESEIVKTGENEISGWVIQQEMPYHKNPDNGAKLHFVLQLDRAPDAWQAWRGQEHLGELRKRVEGRNSGTFARYQVKKGDSLLLRVGLSWCSVENARLNLETEATHWNFDRYCKESRDIWNEWLSRIEVKGGTEAQKIKFYTDVWHALLGRRQLQDVNGQYPDRLKGPRRVGQLPVDEQGRPQFWHMETDAWWLTKWNLNCLWGLAWPQVLNDFINSSMIYYYDGGRLPRGPSIGRYTNVMSGCPVTELIVSSYMKGIRNYDYEAVLKAMIDAHTLKGNTMDADMGATPGRIEEYMQYGYIPFAGKLLGGAGLTVEYATQDWALAQYAKALGHKEIYETFIKRSDYWKNVFDTDLGFIRPKMKDGAWVTPFDPIKDANFRGFCEANSWQTTWMITNDIQGLKNMLGGTEEFCKKLNFAFEQSVDINFVAGPGKSYLGFSNQPGLCMAHLFNLAGQPWLSQKWVRAVNEQAFGCITPYGGYANDDEDQGQLGAFSALMSIGLFHADGACYENPVYDITAPVFDEVTIHLDSNYYSGKEFKIITKNNNPKNVYIQSAKLNGKPYNRCWIYHKNVVAGGVLELDLGPEPNEEWGISELVPSATAPAPEFSVKVESAHFPRSLKCGEEYSVKLQVSNSGVEGVLPLYLDYIGEEQPIKLKNVFLREGETKEVVLKRRFFLNGQHTLEVNGQAVQNILFVARPGEYHASNLKLTQECDKVLVSGLVQNIGSNKMTAPLALKANGKEIATCPMELEPGAEKEVELTAVLPGNGTYTLDFNGFKKYEVKVDRPAYSPEKGLCVYFDFTNAPYKLCDLSGNSIHPIMVAEGHPVLDAEKDGVLFKNRGCLILRGIEQASSIADGFTVSTLIKPLDWNGNRRIVEHNGILIMSYENKFTFELSGIGILKCELPSLNEWVRVTCSYDKTGLQKIWFDDQLMAQQKVSGTCELNTTPFTIGSKSYDAYPEDYFIGYMKDFRLYAKVVDPSSIR